MDAAAWAQLLSAGGGFAAAVSGGVLAWRSDLARRAALRDAAMSASRAHASETTRATVETLERSVAAAHDEAGDLRKENRKLRMDLARHRVSTDRALAELREAVDQCHLEKLQLLQELAATRG